MAPPIRRKKIGKKIKGKKMSSTPSRPNEPRPSTSARRSSDESSDTSSTIGTPSLPQSPVELNIRTRSTTPATARRQLFIEVQPTTRRTRSTSSTSSTEDIVPIDAITLNEPSCLSTPTKRRHILTPQISVDGSDQPVFPPRVTPKKSSLQPSSSSDSIADDPSTSAQNTPRRRNRRIVTPIQSPYSLRRRGVAIDDLPPPTPLPVTPMFQVATPAEVDDGPAAIEQNAEAVIEGDLFDEAGDEFLRTIDIDHLMTQQEDVGILGNQRPIAVPRTRGRFYLHAERPSEQVHTAGRMIEECMHCHALYFFAEKPQRGYTKCCGQGKIVLPPHNPYPQEFLGFFQDRHFMENIRYYNNAFAFASLGANIVTPPGRGPFCFKVQGQIRHNLGHIATNIPADQRRYGGLYFMDTAEANRARLAQAPVLDPAVVDVISNFLTQHNPFAGAYQTLREVYQRDQQARQQNGDEEEPTYQLYIDNDRHPNRQINFQQYGAVQSNEVVGIFVSNPEGEPPVDRCIFVYCRAQLGHFYQLPYLSANCDPMLYPILFPHGDPGYITNQPHTRGGHNISVLEYYAYRLAVRPREFNAILNSGKLTQQFIVDSYIKVEQSRLDYIRQNQYRLRVEAYQGLLDYLNQRQLNDGIPAGAAFILPSTFIGSPRCYRQNYLDAMSIVAKQGKPDLFITFTCNPKWPEITANLLNTQHASDRPDLVSRVFKIKLDSLMEDIFKAHIFGVCAAFVYVIEFQKRGLPHAHILLWLDDDNKILDSAGIDRLISAELPDQEAQPELFTLVTAHMIHGPCNHQRCLDDTNKCKKGFPKPFRPETLFLTNGYPIYRRRNLNPNNQRVNINDAWVVSYNQYLLRKYQAHINVEACSSIKSVKYLFKYVYKGYDRAHVVVEREPNNRQVRVEQHRGGQHLDEIQNPPEQRGVDVNIGYQPQGQNLEVNYDEIKMFLDVRYVSAPEAIWRLQKFNLHDISHNIIRLAVHLPDRQQIYFRQGDELNAVDRVSHTTLTAWFVLNQNNHAARLHTYVDIPYYYVFDGRLKQWKERQRGQHLVLPRIYFVHPAEGERFYLRLLLHHVRGACSFEDLKTVNGIVFDSFRDAAVALNLIDTDNVWFNCLNEAAATDMPRQLRRMFARMLLLCTIADPIALWDQFKVQLSEDYQRYIRGNNNDINDREQAFNCTLIFIERFLRYHGKRLTDFNLPEPLAVGNLNPIVDYIEDGNNENLDVDLQRQNAQRDLLLLNRHQRFIFDNIINILNQFDNYENTQRYFYLDGEAGCGKTFLINTLIAYLISQNQRYIAMAFTGIAAALLRGGKTVHNTFMFPVPFDHNSESRIRNQSSIAENIRHTRVIIWDEISMISKFMLSAVDKKLREITGNPQLPFGGKIMVLCGDFRQCAPIVPLGGKAETLEASVKSSPLWNRFTRFELNVNVRALENGGHFSEWLLSIGNASNPLRRLNNAISETIVELPQEIVVDDIVQAVYGDRILSIDDQTLFRKAILSPRNVDVRSINSNVLSKLPQTARARHYYSVDTILHQDGSIATDDDDLAAAWPQEFLNSLESSTLPSHELVLKPGAIIMLTKNLDVARGLCNGTRLKVLRLHEHFIEAQLPTPQGGNINAAELTEFIPRVDNFGANTVDLPVNMRRRQFPVKLAFAMTINKSQGQTLDTVGLYLPTPVFDHGQLYVAISRARSFNGIKCQLTNILGRQQDGPPAYTVNVVYDELLQNTIATLRLPPQDN